MNIIFELLLSPEYLYNKTLAKDAIIEAIIEDRIRNFKIDIWTY